LCGKPIELPCVMPLPANSPRGAVNVSFCFAQNAIQIVRMIKMIGAITVVVPRNFIATYSLANQTLVLGFTASWSLCSPCGICYSAPKICPSLPKLRVTAGPRDALAN
jgi:hypothetical protein